MITGLEESNKDKKVYLKKHMSYTEQNFKLESSKPSNMIFLSLLYKNSVAS